MGVVYLQPTSYNRTYEAMAGSSGSMVGQSQSPGGGQQVVPSTDPGQTDQAGVPQDGSLLDGVLPDLTDILDLGSRPGGTPDGATPGTGSGMTPTPGDSAGSDGSSIGGILAPITDVVGGVLDGSNSGTGASVIDDVLGGLLGGDAMSPGTGGGSPSSGGLLDGITGSNDGSGLLGDSSLLTDVLTLPGDLVGGAVGDLLTEVGQDVSNVVDNVLDTTTGLVDNLVGGDSNPVSNLLDSLGSDIAGLPLLSVSGGEDGGLLSGVVGDLSGSSSGHLIDASVGPEQESGGLLVDLLSSGETGSHNAIDVNAVDVGQSGPNLASLDLLTGDSGLLGDANDLDLGSILNADHGILNLQGVHLI